MAYQRIPLDAKEGAREARAQNRIENSSTPQGMRDISQLDPMAMGGVTPMPEQEQATADIGPMTDIVDPMEQLQAQQAAQDFAMEAEGQAQAMLNPVEMLRLRSEQAEDEVSLDTLSSSEKEKILKAYIQCRGIAKKYYEEIIEPEILERREIYWGEAEHYDKVFPQLSEFCRWVSKDVKTTCDWILPGLMETFTGSDSPISVKGVSVEDDSTASKIQELVQYQLTKKNDFHGFVRSNIDTALRENWSVAKVWWNREEEHIKMKMLLDLNESDSLIALIQGEMSGKISIKKMKELDGAPDLMEVEYEEIKPKFNYPAIDFVPSSEIRFTPDATILRDCKFVAHRKIVKGDYLKRRERDGIYKNVDKALAEYGDGDTEPSVLDLYNDRERMDKLRKTNDNDIASKEVELYEAYLDVDYNNDGIFEKLIVHAVGDNLISVQKNESDIAPFFECCSIYDPNRIFPLESFSGQFEQQQDLKTAMVRSIIINTTKNNMPRQYVDEHKVDMDALLSGEEIVPTMGNPTEAVFVPSSLPLAGITMDLINYAQNELEAQSGSTRYNQGLDSNSLNKMLALDTPIPMADGSYKLNGEIIEGDVLIGSDGKPTTVTKAHPVQMPEKAYLMTFQNGEQIKSGGEHRWAVKICESDFSYMSEDFEKLPASRIYELMETGHRAYIPYSPVIEYSEKEYFLDPYILGLWLGDGHAHTNRFTTMDEEIVEAFRSWAKQFYKGDVECTVFQNSGRAHTYCVKNTPLREMLKDLGVLKDRRYEETRDNRKHIPEMYLKGSVEQRLAMLQGLMDTDGCITKEGYCIFSNSEPALVETTAELIRTLGGIPNIVWKDDAKGPNAKPYAQIHFNIPMCPVRLVRKADRWKAPTRNDKQRIISMVEIPVEPMRCLTVSAVDELYCCGKCYTITSNTATGVTAVMGASEKRNKLMARSIAENFFIPIYKYIIELNQMYLEDEQIIRLTNESIKIRKEDLDIDYDLVVNVGEGTGTKEAQIQYIMYLMTNVYPVLQQMSIVNEASWYGLAKRLLEQIGLRDTTNFLVDPSSQEAQQAKQQAQQQAQMAQDADLERAIRLNASKTAIPRISVNLTDMPPVAQQAWLENTLGLPVTEKDIVEHEAFTNE